VAPAHELLHQGLRDELLAKEESEDLALEELSQEAVLEGSQSQSLSRSLLTIL
jgi:hypothetical protein